MSKDINKVWHDGLLLFKSYLSNRNQRVVINGFESEWGLIETGVPQRSVWDPSSF